jgi:hypothetical protein
MNEYHIGQTRIPYEIEWSPDRSTISIALDSSMEMTIKAPVDTSLEDVKEVLDSRQSWLLETLYGLSEQKDPPLDKEFLSGEKLLLNGRRYRLKVRQGDVPEPTVSFDGQRFDLVGPRSTKMTTREKRQAVVDWYIEEARNQLPERVRKFARKLGVEQVDTEVRDLTRKWGEYRSGRVSLHWRLTLAPVRIQN